MSHRNLEDSRRSSEDIDLQEVARLVAEIEQKESSLYLEGNNDEHPITSCTVLSTNTGTNRGDTTITQRPTNSDDTRKHPKQVNRLIVIIMHVLLLYCVVTVTYLLLVHNLYTHCECSQVITDTAITYEPTVVPTISPSDKPSYRATLSPTRQPSDGAINASTLNPIHNSYSNYIGDYKISLQNSSHGYWKLCDGSFVDKNDYPELFDIMGHSFDLFALPNPKNNVLAMSSDKYQIGTIIGNENITLTESNLPSHHHLLISDGSGCGALSGANTYLSRYCHWSGYDEWHPPGVATEPTMMKSSSIGSNIPINIMQPTLYIGNLFIYTGRF